MALGLQTESAGGDFLPIVKFDARAGRFFRRDRANNENTDVDITRAFKAVLDMENIEVGFINFATGSAPDFVLVPLGEPMPHKPSGEGYKQGFRMTVKLGAECGGDVREFSSCAKVVIKGLDLLHEAYGVGEKLNQGKLPVVVLKDTIPVTSEGKQKSTNYQPVFEIVGWAPRPKDLIAQPRSRSALAPAVPVHSAPSTGSTIVPPPGPTPLPANNLQMADAEDFG